MRLVYVCKRVKDVTLSVRNILINAAGGLDATVIQPEELQDYDPEAVYVGLGVDVGDWPRTLSPKEMLSRSMSQLMVIQAVWSAVTFRDQPVDAHTLLTPDNYHVLGNTEELRWLCRELKAQPPTDYALDIEVAGDVDKDVFASNPLLSIALYDGVSYTVISKSMAEHPLTARALQILCDNHTVICHNGTFDMPILSTRLGVELRHHEDTMLMHFVMYNTAGEHGLEDLAVRWLGAKGWKAQLKPYLKGNVYYENVPLDILYAYNAVDVHWTYHLAGLFRRLLEEQGMTSYYEYRMRVAHMLHDIQITGVNTDMSVLAELRADYSQRVDNHLSKLCSMVGPNFNPGSWQQVKKAFAERGIELKSTDSDHLTKVKRQGLEVELVDEIISYREATKVLGSYINKIIEMTGPDGKIHPTYLPHGTKSGRLSAKNPPIQTMGRDSGIKRALVAAPGNTIVACDYSQAELRTVAELADDTAMIGAFAEGAPDFFDDLQTKIYPELYPTLEDMKAYKKANPLEAKNQRALIKGVVYGCVTLDHEILTDRGVLSHKEVRVGDKTWGINPQTGKGEWTEILHIHYYMNAPTYVFEGPGLSIRTTTNHRWLVEQPNGQLGYSQLADENKGDLLVRLSETETVPYSLYRVKLFSGKSCPVWCVTTTTGNWTTFDSNGRQIITGNSNYGRGARAIAEAIGQPVEDAQRVLDQYYSAYPNFAKWQRNTRNKMTQGDHTLTTPFGFKFLHEYVASDKANKVQNEALSFVPQSTANDICLHAALQIHQKTRQYGANIVGLVHDAIYVECPKQHADACGQMMEQEMTRSAQLVFNRVKFVAEAEQHESWEE